MSTEPESKKLCLGEQDLMRNKASPSNSDNTTTIKQEDIKTVGDEKREHVNYNTQECNEDLLDNKGNTIIRYIEELANKFALLIPVKVNSEAEDSDFNVLIDNFGRFGVEYKYDRSNGLSCEVWVKPRLSDRQYLIGCNHSLNARKRLVRAAAEAKAIRNLKRFCNYVEPNPEWFQAHKTPDFIKNLIPCDQTPPSYKIFTKQDTGTISKEKAEHYGHLLRNSSMEELFFLADHDFQEKTNLINRTSSCNGNIYDLKFRHFGEESKFVKRHCCIYKIKSAVEIIKEILRGGKNPRWLFSLRNHEFIRRRCSTQSFLQPTLNFNEAVSESKDFPKTEHSADAEKVQTSVKVEKSEIF